MAAWYYSSIRLNGNKVRAIKRPAGEIGVMLENPTEPRHSSIEAVLRSSDDLITLALVVDAARRIGAKYIKLLLPYIPYARHDRAFCDGDAHSMVVFSNLINSMSFDEVTVFDPYSDVSEALIKNIRIIKMFGLMQNLPKDSIGDVIVSPRHGVGRRARECGIKFQIPVAYAEEVEEAIHSIVTGHQLSGAPVDKKTCMIVDDICEDGASIISLAKHLRAQGARDVKLFVTHGLFTKGFAPFAGLVSEIYFTNSLRQDPPCDPFSINIWRDKS